MIYNRRKADNSNWFRKNWYIITFLTTIIFFSGIYVTIVLSNQSRLTKLEIKVEEMSNVRNDIVWMKESLKQIDRKLDKLNEWKKR